MLHRMAINESESEVSDAASASDLDISDRTPSMSTVYSDSPRASSPSSTTSSRKSSFPLHLRKSSSSSGSDYEKKKKEKEDGLSRWLRDGTVVYKSVGLGLMDLVVGTHIIKVAKEKNIGTNIATF